MKIINYLIGGTGLSARYISYPLLFAVLFCTSGCVSGRVVGRARGYTNDPAEPRKGDTVFSRGASSYVVQQKSRERDTAEKMSEIELQKYRPPYYAFDPSPGCYVFLLVSAPMDAATLPFQALYALQYAFGAFALAHGQMH